MAKKTGEILLKLRALMKNNGQLSAYIVPSDDPHMSEYVSPNFHRRAYVSGFTGSAGTAIILLDRALLWTDGRYFLQAEQQMDENWTLMKAFMPNTPTEEQWLSSNLKDSAKVGIDPRTCSVQRFKTLRKSLNGVGLELTPVKENLIDMVWTDAPAPPTEKVFLHDVKFAGEATSKKLDQIREKMSAKQCDTFIVSALDDIAWLFNLRGSDVSYNPVFYSFAIVGKACSTLFVDDSKLSSEIKVYLESIGTKVRPYNDIYDAAAELSGRVLLPLSTNAAISQAIKPLSQIIGMSPIQELKAIKNDVELQGMRDCHIRDGAALCEYLHWLGVEVHKDGAVIDEVDGADKAEYFRSKYDKYVSLSFDTISSSGANGAIIHYSPEKGSCLQIDKNDIYLCDSGAQFSDGTTDVTRTIHLGTPTAQQINHFTRVLQGHIELAMAVFPPGTKGTCLDCLARKPLWDIGLNYQHGTGHGVGSFLNVHEGPCRISAGNRISKYEMGLQKGMILSDEPGYYEKDKYGIRIESLVEVVETSLGPEKARYLTFSTITMAPIDRKLVDITMLTSAQVAWLDNYHADVYEKVNPLFKGKSEELKKWLYDETRPIVEK